jgi:hypothetical protein
MKKYLTYAIFVGIFGMLLFILNLTLELRLIHPLALPVLIIVAVAFTETLITFKLSAGLSARMVLVRVLQMDLLSIVITSLPMLASAGYLWFLQTQQPGQISIQTAHANYYRDAPEVAFDVFVFMILIGLGLSVILSFTARYFASKKNRFNLIAKNSLMILEADDGS